MGTKYYNIKVKSGAWEGYIMEDGKVGKEGKRKRYTKKAADAEAYKRALGSRFLQFWRVDEGE